MDTLCRKGCYLEMTMKRTQEQERHKTRLRTYRRLVDKMKAAETPCNFCSSLADLLHHKDEDHSNNRPENLVPMCKEHHLATEHKCDSASFRFEEEAVIRSSSMTWTSAKRKRIERRGHPLGQEVLQSCSTPPYLPWETNKGGRVEFFWRTRWLHPVTESRITASGTPRLMELLEKWGFKEIPRQETA